MVDQGGGKGKCVAVGFGYGWNFTTNQACSLTGGGGESAGGGTSGGDEIIGLPIYVRDTKPGLPEQSVPNQIDCRAGKCLPQRVGTGGTHGQEAGNGSRGPKRQGSGTAKTKAKAQAKPTLKEMQKCLKIWNDGALGATDDSRASLRAYRQGTLKRDLERFEFYMAGLDGPATPSERKASQDKVAFFFEDIARMQYFIAAMDGGLERWKQENCGDVLPHLKPGAP